MIKSRPMSELLGSYNLDATAWVLLAFGGIMIGITKTGLSGASIIVLPIFATMFGGKHAAGIMLPILTFGDILGLLYYHRHADSKRLLKLLPWALVGIAVGLAIGRWVDDSTFKRLIGVFVLVGLVLMVHREYSGREIALDRHAWVAPVMGIAGGFVSMIANAGGTIMGLYFLAMKLPKNVYIATNVWFIFIINVVKIPFQILLWGYTDLKTLALDLVLVPAVVLGFLLGLVLLRWIPEKKFRLVIICLTAIAAVRLLA